MSEFDIKKIKIHEGKNDTDLIKNIIKETESDDPFYILDIEDIIEKHKLIVEKMPRVVPHYAVKCNPDPTVIQTLAAMNANFDCASKQEIQLVLKMGVSNDRIIYAHPGKAPSHIKFAKKVGVEKTTVDSKSEILKLKKLYPEAKLLIRVALDGSADQCGVNFSKKFGCEVTTEVIELMEYMKNLKMTLLGFCFHLGSPCLDTSSYGKGIKVCNNLINIAKTMGHIEANVIDIGGGIQGQDTDYLNKLALSINDALKHVDPKIEIISEPGRYYVESAFTLSACIIGKKTIKKDDNIEKFYYVNDGTYGAFIEELLDIKHRIPNSLYCQSNKMFVSTIWGRTADPYDILVKSTPMQDFEEEDWMIWKNMGAYTSSLATTFNGFIPASVYPFIRKSSLNYVLNEMKNNIH